MKCEDCSVPGFIFPEMYCNACPDKPKPKIKTGRAYLFQKNFSKVVCSVQIEAPEGLVSAVAAEKLTNKFRIDFIEGEI